MTNAPDDQSSRIIAFTGPSELTGEQELQVVEQIEDHASDLYTFRSGCAFGVDTIAARQGFLSGVLLVELYVPAARHNIELVEELAPRATVIRCPSSPEPYRTRNEMMVKGSDILVAFARSRSFYRSGEWMTINIALRLGIHVQLNLI